MWGELTKTTAVYILVFVTGVGIFIAMMECIFRKRHGRGR